MNFYNKGTNQDRLYLEIATKYNIAYWIASDLYHYTTSFPHDFNEYEYKRMLSQYSLAAQIMYESDDLAQFITGDHKTCLRAERVFIEACLIDFRIDKIFSPNLDSEAAEVQLRYMEDCFERYSEQYKQFLLPESCGHVLLQSFEYFANAQWAMIKLNSQFEFNTNEINKRFAEDIVDEFMSARILLDQGIDNINVHDEIISEFKIITSENKIKPLNEDFLEYFKANLNYMNLWREVYSLYEEFYKDLILNSYDLPDSEIDLLNHNSEQYFSRINKSGIELSLAILDYMEIKVPHVEIYSARKIKNPTDFLIKKYLRS